MAGGDISEKLPYLRTESRCPALLPLHTRPLASYVIDFYRANHDVHLFVNEEFRDLVAQEIPALRNGYTLHGVGPSDGVVATLRMAMAAVPEAEDIIVNLVTTVPVSAPTLGEVQVAHLPLHHALDCSALLGDSSSYLQFYAKGEARPDDARAFTGVFRLRAESLHQAILAAPRVNDLLSVLEQASLFGHLNVQQVDWIDCGHESNYYRSRAALINSRSFNKLHVDTHRGTIIKSSSEKTKLAHEVAYLETLPADLRVLYPRLVSVSGTRGKVDSYEMEYYGYPNLAEYLLYWSLSKESWWRCFDSLDSTLSLLRAHRTTAGIASYRDFHWEKTIRRIDQYLSSITDPSLRDALSSSSLRIGHETCAPLPQLLEQAEKVILGGYRESEFSVVHGDFCFNNILFDVSSGIIRLIDPRGSFGPTYPGTWGDRRYDLAKLAHSSIGGYDFMVNGLFTVQRQADAHFDLILCQRSNAAWLAEMTDWLIQSQQADPREIAVMTALLFLSMCPLHADDSSRQLAFFLRGLQLLQKSL
ncbi:MAG: hypothetical protein EAZ81_05590 [Verrucomicrobia bacterium]|nr:MAG: hypothetical protein EAZ81_05590 [Verrucomicrobiota bacterium]